MIRKRTKDEVDHYIKHFINNKKKSDICQVKNVVLMWEANEEKFKEKLYDLEEKEVKDEAKKKILQIVQDAADATINGIKHFDDEQIAKETSKLYEEGIQKGILQGALNIVGDQIDDLDVEEQVNSLKLFGLIPVTYDYITKLIIVIIPLALKYGYKKFFEK